MSSTTSGVRVEEIAEKGESFVALSTAQAVRLQELKFCRVSPTGDTGIWRITDVTRVGVAGIDGVRLIVRPKTALRSLIFMASYSGVQTEASDLTFAFEADRDLPSTLASALIGAVNAATGRALLKGYVSVEETGTVIRGRWDVARQLKARPGLPVPVELTYDDYTEDVAENQIVKAALRALVRLEQLPRHVVDEIGPLLGMFAEISDLQIGGRVTLPAETRLNGHYQPALRLAQWILEATSWAHAEGASSGSTFLLNVAKVYEDFVGSVLRATLKPEGFDVDLQVSDWRLDTGGKVRMRPDIVISRHGRVVAVADTKYKVWGEDDGSPPNADVYQGLAYAVTAEVQEVHLLYVSGDVEPRRYEIAATGTVVMAHAVDVSGGPEELVARVAELARALVASNH
ncbi:5-methylcytosine-specific restriction enzyme subunit McrC [Microbacterium foliorum]|uniref:McrC family protein n=1 Tax=Microbacterium foliorum TaxID=104336 RepID=UPI0020A0BBA3|nr:McrC family protein [Microbacterium foliorum]MCP1428528.1 5-methylcytosine-specific restriction enzyme subunit McrC [Microbacterium foliorum]